MSINKIQSPLPGERVVSVSPRDAAEAADTWLRRPNLFPGRALTAPTLEARSLWAAGRIAQRGQAFTAGVVRGLDTGYTVRAPEETGERSGVSIYVGAGRGLAASGEDVVLAREIEADFWSLQVVAPPAVFEGGGFGGGGVLQPRAVGPTLGALLDERPGVLPRAGILVLQPAAVDKAEIDPDDPCDRCDCEDGSVAFEDWRFADAARLLWYAWPEDWRPPPPPGARFRNQLAWSVFDGERVLSAGEILPWEEFGIPVALVGVDADYLPTFSDRASVVRRGGRARHPRLQVSTSDSPGLWLATSHRLPGLWQAQIEQLAEQVAEMGEPAPEPDELVASLDRLPPFGLLPRNVIDLDTFQSDFFPAGFDLDAVPIPMEQLDLALRESAGMAPLDLAAGDRVRVLVPVSQASYEPRLLQEEEIDPEFEATLDRFMTDRDRALGGRQSVRVKSSVILRALRGEAPPVPAVADDPLALEPESLDGWAPPGAQGGHRVPLAKGLHGYGFQGASETMTPAAGERLYAWAYLDPDRPPRTLMLEWRRGGGAERRAYWGENLIELGTDGRNTRLRIGDLPPTGEWVRLEVPASALDYEESDLEGMAFRLYDGWAAFGPSGVLGDDGEVPWFDADLPGGADTESDGPFTFLTANDLLAPFEDGGGVVPASENGEFPEGISEALEELSEDARLTALLSDSEQAQLEARGVEGFVAYLRARADRADDLVDYGFLKVQTDVYRMRQFVLGTTDATRLAVSPTLAGIAQAETAVASQERLTTFFEGLGGSKPPIAGAAAGFGGSSSGAAGGASPAGAAAPGGGESEGGAAPGGASVESGGAAPSGRASVSEGAIPSMAGLGGAGLSSIGIGTGPTGVTSSSDRSSRDLIRDIGMRDIGIADNTVVATTAAQSSANLISGLTLGQPFVTTKAYTPLDITNAMPLVGNFEVRTLSVAERLQIPKAQEARDYSTSTRHEAVIGLVRLADDLTKEDGEVPGLFDDIDVWGLLGDSFLPEPNDGDPVVQLRRPFADFLAPATRVTLIAALLTPPLRDSADEARYFSDSADLADRTVALLRQVEGRVKRYRDVISVCEATSGKLRGSLSALGVRERAWAEVLGEARHDVAVTRALITEEQARLDAINARRAAILDKEVRFLAYMRTRAADNLSPAASRTLDPGLLEAPVPSCLRDFGEIPEELLEMLKVVREAPADWFKLRAPLLSRLDRVDLLLSAVRSAQLRAQRVQAEPLFQVAQTSGLLAALGKVDLAQRRRVSLSRTASLQLDVSRLAALSWKSVRAEAAKVVSLGDLIEGGHGQGSVARDAAGFFERFGRVCGCLHAGFSEVVPSIRLDWAEILSQFDEAPNLRNLASLPRWSEIEYEDRRRLQGLVDWLFDQLDPQEAEARGLIDDVVRMSILLASHAPVGRILAGRLPRPVTARPGLRIPLLPLEPGRLRVGMQALVYRANAVVARAVVEDLGSGEASARVTYTAQASVELDETVRVQFAPARAVSFAAQALGRS